MRFLLILMSIMVLSACNESRGGGSPAPAAPSNPATEGEPALYANLRYTLTAEDSSIGCGNNEFLIYADGTYREDACGVYHNGNLDPDEITSIKGQANDVLRGYSATAACASPVFAGTEQIEVISTAGTSQKVYAATMAGTCVFGDRAKIQALRDAIVEIRQSLSPAAIAELAN